MGLAEPQKCVQLNSWSSCMFTSIANFHASVSINHFGLIFILLAHCNYLTFLPRFNCVIWKRSICAKSSCQVPHPTYFFVKILTILEELHFGMIQQNNLNMKPNMAVVNFSCSAKKDDIIIMRVPEVPKGIASI